MPQRNWTEPQRHSIEARGGTLLVSAAAGSGKTAVLVERILRIITNPEHPVDVDHLLVVTFTRAAAAEMLQRLAAALAELAADAPENPLYQRQQLLLPRAHISTVHSFCSDVLREYAAMAGVPPCFRVVEDSQTHLLQELALDRVLEEKYRQADPTFLALLSQLSDKSSDDTLRETVLRADEFMQAQAMPEAWLREQLEQYTQLRPLEETPWMESILRWIGFSLEHSLSLIDRATEIARQAGLEPYVNSLILNRQQLIQLVADLEGAEYDALQRRILAYGFQGLKPVKAADAAEEESKEQVKALFKKARDGFSKLKDTLSLSAEECRQDLAQMAPMVEALGDLVTAYRAEYTARKREKKWLDFGDLEHECLRILQDEAGAPTPLARELAGRFEYILIDECQDNNAAQDALFHAISRGGENLFFVGDVKQSIYSFRQAMPELFTARRDTFVPFDPENPVYPATVTLENNFRSRLSVTDSVNFLFRQLMHRSLGGVEYDEREALVCSAAYSPAEDTETEWLLLENGNAQQEAQEIGKKIREAVGHRLIQGKDGPRTLEYGDVCILLRHWKKASVFVHQLNAMGIPAGATGGNDLLDTPEVLAVLALLRAIDNPLREVELTAAMMSPVFGFSADDLALLRIAFPSLPLFSAVERYTAEGEREALRAECARFSATMRRLRTLAVSLPADRLLERMDRELGITAVYAARSGGKQRVANLHQLDRMARSFEQDGFRGLSAFVRHIDSLQERGSEIKAGSALREERVQVMTVHSSKGLEFPVVFLASLSAQFSKKNERTRLLLHHRAGIGLKLKSEQEKHDTLPFTGVKLARKMDERAEELRLWYVALTRAREKLYLVISQKDVRRQLAQLEMQLPNQRALPPYMLLSAQAPAEWFLAAAIRHPSFAFLRTDPTATPSLAAETDFRVTLLTPEEETPPAPATEEAPPPDEALCRQLAERLPYVYAHEGLARVPAKLAASALAHKELQRNHIATARPAFLQRERMTPAQRGTAMHTFMQFADFGRAAVDPAAEAARLTEAGFLTEHQRQALDIKRLAAFFAGPLYARMATSPDCRRELHFVIEIPAGEVATGLVDDEERVMIQGIADCVFQEGDRLVLVDYKTDRVQAPAELAERYRSQLKLYRQALESVFGLPVSEAILYSFALGTAVPVKLEGE